MIPRGIDLTCNWLKWDVRMSHAIEILRARYHARGLYDAACMEVFDDIEAFLHETRQYHFADAMMSFRRKQLQHIHGPTTRDFLAANIINEMMKTAFPNEEPPYYQAREAWLCFTLRYTVVFPVYHAPNCGMLNFFCSTEQDAFDQLLECCVEMPTEDRSKWWLVEDLVTGVKFCTDDFFAWSGNALPDVMFQHFDTKQHISSLGIGGTT